MIRYLLFLIAIDGADRLGKHGKHALNTDKRSIVQLKVKARKMKESKKDYTENRSKNKCLTSNK